MVVQGPYTSYQQAIFPIVELLVESGADVNILNGGDLFLKKYVLNINKKLPINNWRWCHDLQTNVYDPLACNHKFARLIIKAGFDLKSLKKV
jgi:hypothetical protein